MIQSIYPPYGLLTSYWKQGSQFRTVPAGIAGVYRTDKQTSTYNPPYFIPEKIPAVPANFEQYRAYRPVQKKKVFFFCFLSFVIFEFLLRQNCNCKDLICNDPKVVLGSYVKSPNNKICRAWAERLGLVTG